jgi:hypothetical protein
VLSRRHQTIFEQFDRLPDDAIVPDQVAAVLLNMSPWTLNRSNPAPKRQISERIGGRRVGDLRALARGETVSQKVA